MKYTQRDGEIVLFFFKKTVTNKAQLIGSLGKGLESNHDIDILLPGLKKTVRLRNQLFDLLEAKSYVNTDWGGIYFQNTFFGDVDVFFTTKGFNY